MKNSFLVFAILCFPVFLSFSKVDGEKFIGEWNVINKNREIDHIDIKKDGKKYLLIYRIGLWGQGGEHDLLSLTYRYKDGILVGTNKYGNVEFIESSGHLRWNKDEWRKTSDKTK